MADSTPSQEKQKRTQPVSPSSIEKEVSDAKKSKHDIVKASPYHDVEGSVQTSGGENHDFDHLPRIKCRLQILQHHNILENALVFLNETDLYRLENAYLHTIGLSTFARQWSSLSCDDEERRIFAHRRWRDSNAEDTAAVMGEIAALKNIDLKYETNGDESDKLITTVDYPCEKILLARHLGRKFAEEAIFVEDREKEARQIYDFDLTPSNDSEHIPLSMKYGSPTDLHLSTSPYPFSLGQHWQEWYDYRVNSVHNKNAFVRLSLRDGSGRYWHGFRRLATIHNKTFFSFHFDLCELIQDMQWIELQTYLRLTSDQVSPDSMRKRVAAVEHMMEMIQLTVSIEGKLLIATGGYSPHAAYSSIGFRLGIENPDPITNGKCYFHSRHYRSPLSTTTKNDLKWKPYRTSLAHDSLQNEMAVLFDCDHTDLPFMRPEDIGNPNAHAHW